MRVGVYDPYLDDLGGGEKYMMSIASCLSGENEVDVFWDKKEDITKLLERFHLDLSKVNIVKNIFSSQIGLFKRFFTTRKYDAIIVLSDGSIPLVGSRKLFLHVQQPLENAQTHGMLGKIKMSRVSRVFCNSYYTKDFVDRLLHAHAAVIYPPVSIHEKKVKKENIILHVGRFRLVDPLTQAGDYKKQRVMVDSFKEMVDKGLTKWKFVLAISVMEKEKDAFEKMKESAKGYPIEFLVNKSNDTLWDTYSKAKIYWHASGFGEDLKAHPEFAEHFGISTVEAMGAGAVPVVINAGGQKEIVEDKKNGLLWDTLDELQEKTLLLTKNAKEMVRLSNNAKERAKDFSYEKFRDAVFTLVR